MSKIWDVIARFICARFGHTYVDESVIGPDSGTEAFRCKRCGYNWSHTYY